MARHTVPIALHLILVLGISGCVKPNTSMPGRASVRGVVQLVPREGVVPAPAGKGAYGDRSLRGVELLDYSRPGFAVVYTDGDAPTDVVDIVIRETSHLTRLEPKQSVAGAAGSIRIHNETSEPHIVSDPIQGTLRTIKPNEVLVTDAPSAGFHAIHVIDRPGLQTGVFVAPGPYAVVSPRGRYELNDLEVGRRTIRAWHGQFPTVSHLVHLRSDRQTRLDIQLGVDVESEVNHVPN